MFALAQAVTAFQKKNVLIEQAMNRRYRFFLGGQSMECLFGKSISDYGTWAGIAVPY